MGGLEERHERAEIRFQVVLNPSPLPPEDVTFLTNIKRGGEKCKICRNRIFKAVKTNYNQT